MIWPDGFNPLVGFSDEQLEELCSDKNVRREGKPAFSSPWLFYTSEMYSHGSFIREWLGWPAWLPIPAFSDHGVQLNPNLYKEEISSPAKVHLTWSSWRVRFGENAEKKIVPIPHPWHVHIKRANLSVRENADGLLVFLPHELPGHEFIQYDYSNYIRSVTLELGEPSALMIPMHSVRSGTHKKLRDLNIPLLSAGNTESPMFGDRFIDIVSNFRRATSSAIGSQAYFAADLGLDYVIFGERPREPYVEPNWDYTREDAHTRVFQLTGPQKDKALQKLLDDALGRHFATEADANRVREVLRLQLLDVPRMAWVLLVRRMVRILGWGKQRNGL